MASGINIGVRHILPIYPLLAIAAAYAVMNIARPLAIALVIVFAIETTLAHPDYLAWFNVAAGPHPEHIAVDSNLDWGQDVRRLERVVRQRKIDHIYVAYFGAADWRRHVPNSEELPEHRVTGWIAVSEMRLRIDHAVGGRKLSWLDAYAPVDRAGKSIRLYYIAP
jgi:hypothetical protein